MAFSSAKALRQKGDICVENIHAVSMAFSSAKALRPVAAALHYRPTVGFNGLLIGQGVAPTDRAAAALGRYWFQWPSHRPRRCAEEARWQK